MFLQGLATGPDAISGERAKPQVSSGTRQPLQLDMRADPGHDALVQ